MKRLLLVLALAAMPLASLAKKPLPTDPESLRMMALKGNKEAMYELAMLLDPIECQMDMESINVSPSPGAERTSEAYEWYKAAARKKHPQAYWKFYCMLIYPREGLDFTPEQRFKELADVRPTETYELLYGHPSNAPKKYKQNVELCYNLALCNYCGYANAVFKDIKMGLIGISLHYRAYECARLVIKYADPSHPYYKYAEKIAEETYAAWDEHRMNERMAAIRDGQHKPVNNIYRSTPRSTPPSYGVGSSGIQGTRAYNPLYEMKPAKSGW
jgi:TPR repeat protein